MELLDQHLMAEYREITRVAKLARVLLDYGYFKLGTGHVKFFYNKGAYLSNRTQELYDECIKRGMNVQHKKYSSHIDILNKDWIPTVNDEMITATRLNEKYDQKPKWYKFWGNPLTQYEGK